MRYEGNAVTKGMHLIAKDYVNGDPENLLAPEDRYAKDLVEFRRTGNKGLQLVSSLHSSVLRPAVATASRP